ncbi:MAG: hypothetical protein A3F14_06275 [Gammaproteobacteria bacterium RIFCSPHIGHO2_12_FULL_43_28]|nr:MAG: hypothetical protein A3F14_06275 [Gammaproteobacteria bacterium RIFCSPHIGHO2_12_FULL_43_28]
MLHLIEKARQIKLLILDIDGVLTSGRIYYIADGTEMRAFHVHDGLGIKLLQNAGIAVAIISGKKSEAAARRMKDLNIQHVYLGNVDKMPAYEELKTKLNLTDEQIAYVGDDLPDLPPLLRAGLAITVPDAPFIIQEKAIYITQKQAGNGAVREVCDMLLKAQNSYDAILKSYR